MSATILTYSEFTVITPVSASYVILPPLYKLLFAEPEAGIIIAFVTSSNDDEESFMVSYSSAICFS